MATRTFKNLIVWQKSRDLAVSIYKLTEDFPQSETYGLASQMRRASISISSNIAEGYNRLHPKDKHRFLTIAYGSGSELESQLDIAKVLFPNIGYQEAETLLDEVMKMLNKLVNNPRY